LTDETVPKLPWFFTGVIPAIIFFVAFVQMLYYWGIIQWFIGKFAVFFFWSMRVSGAEAVVAAATPFIGQGESAMLIKPFVPYLTKAEIHQVMSCGFATIAGSVLIAYINLGLNAQVLVSSCIMSIPASLALSHLRYPEEEECLTAGKIVVPKDESDECANVLEALAKGAWLGIKIAGMIIATLLVIIALLNLVSGLLTWWGRYIGLNGDYDLTVELIVGYIFYPIAFLLGVPRRDILHVARLIGLKVVAVSISEARKPPKHQADQIRRTSTSPSPPSLTRLPTPKWPLAPSSSRHTVSAVSATLALSARKSVCFPRSLLAVLATLRVWLSVR
jgi:CNT family concentrative nucleoside transporter